MSLDSLHNCYRVTLMICMHLFPLYPDQTDDSVARQ